MVEDLYELSSLGEELLEYGSISVVVEGSFVLVDLVDNERLGPSSRLSDVVLRVEDVGRRGTCRYRDKHRSQAAPEGGTHD